MTEEITWADRIDERLTELKADLTASFSLGLAVKNEPDSEAIVILSDTESTIRCYADQVFRALEQCDVVDWTEDDPTEPIWDAIVKCRVC